MISHNIEFLQPDTIDEAVAAWKTATDADRRPRYFSGGTELVTGARQREVFDVLIDLKRIPELTRCDPDGRRFGAAVRLSQLSDQDRMPLLARAAAGIADRTARNSITLGGNLCSALPYREVALPLLLFDATVELAGPEGRREATAGELFEKRMRLEPGELVTGVALPEAALETGFYARRTRDPRVDYPLVTICMVEVDGRTRFAVGGAYGYPIRATAAEDALATGGSRAAMDAIPDRFWDDMRGSAEYRRALLLMTLEEGLRSLEGP